MAIRSVDAAQGGLVDGSEETSVVPSREDVDNEALHSYGLYSDGPYSYVRAVRTSTTRRVCLYAWPASANV